MRQHKHNKNQLLFNLFTNCHRPSTYHLYVNTWRAKEQTLKKIHKLNMIQATLKMEGHARLEQHMLSNQMTSDKR